MQGRSVEGERKAAFDTRQSGNSAGYLSRLFEFQEQLTGEWAQRVYAAHCESWTQQNRTVTGEFIRAMRDRAITPLIATRKSTVQFEVTRRGTATGESPNPISLSEWNRRMSRLATRWSQRLEAEAVAEEYRASRRSDVKGDRYFAAPSSQSGSTVAEVVASNLGTQDTHARKKWSIEAKIALWSLAAVLIIGIATLIATVASPEVRRFFHLDKSSPAASEPKAINPLLQTDRNQNAPQPSASSRQPLPPNSPAEETGIRDNATVVIHRTSPESGAHEAVIATTGNGEQEINLGAAPTKLMFTPPDVVVDKLDLPKKIKVSGQALTVVRYTNSGFVIDDHKHADLHFTVYMVEGDPARHPHP
jgi:hypothetical protein